MAKQRKKFDTSLKLEVVRMIKEQRVERPKRQRKYGH